jgi:hypothetical protein
VTWHVARNGKAWGPITFDDLKRAALDGRLSPDDLVWEPRMVDWQPASQVSGLWGPPPLPQEAQPPPSLANTAEAEQQTRGSRIRRIVFVYVIAASLVTGSAAFAFIYFVL